MKVSKKIAINLIGAAGLVMVSAGVLAHPGGGYGRGGMGPGFGPCAAAADAGAGAACPFGGPGAMRGWQGGGCAYGAGPGPGGGPAAGGPQSLMTDEERQAFRDKMRNATTPEERQKLALENHAEMTKRAAERGIELPPMRGPRMGYGAGPWRGTTPPEGQTR